jgi:NitT/TauT family transport system substrate-binding protein
MYYLALYTAKAKGFFKDEGLDVDIFNSQQRTIALRAIVSGDAFSYNGDPAEPAIARQRGVDCKNIGVLVDRAVQVVLAKKGISKDPKDWKGETIIIPRPPHTAVSLIQMMLIDSGYTKADSDGLVWKPNGGGKNVNLLPVIAGSELSALAAGQANLSITLEPATSIGISKGYVPVTAFADHFGPFFFTSFAVMTDTIKKQPEQVQGFVNAITKAMLFGHKYPDKTAEVAVARYKKTDAKIMRAAAKSIVALGAYPKNMVVSQESYDNNFKRLLPATGHPAANYKFEELMDLSFAEKAAATITDVGPR